MSLTNPNTPVSQQDLQDFYHKLLPYIGGSSGGKTIQVETLPTASADELGNVYQYIGATGTYTHGYFYECVSDEEPTPTYSWEQTSVQPGGGASAMSDLTDVDLNNLQNGQVIKWDATNGKWVNANESGGGGSSTVVAETLLAGSAIVTFTNLPITGDYLLDFYTDTGIGYIAIDTSTAGQVSLTFNSQSSDVTVYCKISECGSSVEKKTLNVGETSITFYSLPTSGNYMTSFYTSNGMNYTDINTATAGQVTLFYPIQTNSVTVFCKVEGV